MDRGFLGLRDFTDGICPVRDNISVAKYCKDRIACRRYAI